MGYRELFLVLTSVLVLSLMTVNVNNTLMQGRETLQEIEIAQIAVSVAQRFIEEAKSKKFDTNVGSLGPGDMPAGFTNPGSLGPGGGETYPNFDDVDDYNNFSTTLYIKGLDFAVHIHVGYVEDTDPETVVNYETYYKRMQVTVTSSWMNGQVILKHVFSYYGSDLK